MGRRSDLLPLRLLWAVSGNPPLPVPSKTDAVSPGGGKAGEGKEAQKNGR